MATGKEHPGICAHCGGEVAEDGYAVRMADGGETDEAKETKEEPAIDAASESGFLEALRRRRSMGTELAEPPAGEG